MTTAIVLAGGLGTRLRSVVPDVPKPMAPVQGKPFLEWLLHYYQEQGVTRFILSVGYLAQSIQSHFGKRWHECEIDYSIETNPLGTGGAILQAGSLLGHQEEVCLAINGDTFFAVNLAKLMAAHQFKKAAITLSAFHSDNVNRYMGMVTDADQRITALNVKSQHGQCLVNGGAYLLNRTLLQTLAKKGVEPQSWENKTLPDLLQQGVPLFAHAIEADFIDIGIPSDYERAQQFNFRRVSSHPSS